MNRLFKKLSMVALVVVAAVLVSMFYGRAFALDAGSLVGGMNAQRSAAGLAPLSYNGQLASAAAAKANDMVVNNYWSHVSPSGATPWYWISLSGYSYTAAGENLSYGYDTADGVLSAWMNSADHRANILSSSFTDVGVGVAYSPNFVGMGPQTIVVAEFGATAYHAPAPAPAPATTTPAAPTNTSRPASAPAPDATPPTDTPQTTTPQTTNTPAPTAKPKPAVHHTKKHSHDVLNTITKPASNSEPSNNSSSSNQAMVGLAATAGVTGISYSALAYKKFYTFTL